MEMPRKPRIVILIEDIIGIHSIEANQPVEVLVIRQDKNTGKDKLMRWGGSNNVVCDNPAYVDELFRRLEEQEQKRGHGQNARS